MDGIRFFVVAISFVIVIGFAIAQAEYNLNITADPENLSGSNDSPIEDESNITNVSTSENTTENITFIPQEQNLSVNIQIMSHLCPFYIQSQDNVSNVVDPENSANLSLESICPIVIDNSSFMNETVTNDTNLTEFIFDSYRFDIIDRNNLAHQWSEAVLVVNNNSAYYEFRGIPSGEIKVRQEVPPVLSRFGVLMMSDNSSLLSSQYGIIKLNLTDSSNSLMLHVHNFRNDDQGVLIRDQMIFNNSLLCADTDRGIFSDQPGYIYSNGDNVFNDSCVSSNYLIEGYCGNGGQVQNVTIYCPDGCDLMSCIVVNLPPNEEASNVTGSDNSSFFQRIMEVFN